MCRAITTHKLTLRELEVAVYQMVRLNAAVQEKTIGTTAAPLGAAADLLQDCLTEGMPRTVLRSVGAALALWVSYGRRCSQLLPALWVWGLGQTRSLPRYTGAALPRGMAHFEHIAFAMLSSMAGVPFGAAALRATLPGGYTPAGKRSTLFGDPLEEISESVEIMRPGFKEMPPDGRKATLFCIHVLRHMPPELPQLLVHVDATTCLEAASRYRLSAIEAFPWYFRGAYRSAFPNLALLMGQTLDPSEAWGLVCQMVEMTPETAAVQALDANVGQMLPYLNTATLRNARAGTRVSEMQNLLRSMLTHNSARKISSTAAREDGAGRHDSPSLSMQEWAKVLSQPLVQVLISKLELLYVAPLEDDRVVRELLGDAAALGVQMVTGSCKPAQPYKTTRLVNCLVTR